MSEAVDHLADREGNVAELLRVLTDDELDEQMAWYRQQRTAARKPVVRNGFTRLLSTAYSVQGERRHENDTP